LRLGVLCRYHGPLSRRHIVVWIHIPTWSAQIDCHHHAKHGVRRCVKETASGCPISDSLNSHSPRRVHVRRLSILRTLPSQDHLQRRHLHRSKELVVRAGMSPTFRRSDIRMDLVGILATNGGLLWSNARSLDGGSGCGLQNDRHEWASMASGIQ